MRTANTTKTLVRAICEIRGAEVSLRLWFQRGFGPCADSLAKRAVSVLLFGWRCFPSLALVVRSLNGLVSHSRGK